MSKKEIKSVVTLKKTISINIAKEEIFEFIIEPNNWIEFCSANRSDLIECKGIERSSDNTYYTRIRWVYNMLGVRFEGEADITEFISNQRLIIKTKGGIESTIILAFQTVESNTQVTLNVEYIVPEPLLNKKAKKTIVWLNEREAETILANLFVLHATPPSEEP